MRTGALLLKMVLPVLVITLVKILEDLFYNPIRKRKVNQSIKEATNKLNDLEGKIVTKDQLLDFLSFNFFEKVYDDDDFEDITEWFPEYSGFYDYEVLYKKGQSSVEAVHDKFFLYPSFYVFQKKIYPISFTTGNPIVFEEDYAADKMKRKEYKAAQIAREHNDFNHTVWDAYENEKRFHG